VKPLAEITRIDRI